MTYDLAIIGGGPAGVAAGVYAARKKLNTIFITKDFEGQSVVSEKIENWIGTPGISGTKLAQDLKKHLYQYEAADFVIQAGEWVTSITKSKTVFTITTNKGTYKSHTILIATGSSRRKLEIPGAAKFDNKGVTYCASCDGPLFSGMDVVVVGGGNAAFESAAQLLAYCKSVTLLHRSENYRADEITVEKVLSHPNMNAYKNIDLMEIKGESFVSGVVIKHKDGKTEEIPTQGVFVEIGSMPNTSFVKDLIKLDQYNRIIVDPRNQRASIAGVWAAGDSTDGLFHQNNIAAGDAVKALEDLYLYIHAASK